jgi:hypothetical protein
MSYNWEQIFKEKSTAELYEIYSGRSFLPIETIDFAKRELENRNFNLGLNNNLETEIKLKAIAEEYVYLTNEIIKKPYRSLSYFLIEYAILTLLMSLFAIINNNSLTISLSVLVLLIIMVTVDNLVSNKIRKKNLGKLNLLEMNRDKLILEQKLSDSCQRNWTKEFEDLIQDEMENTNGLNRILIRITIIVSIAILVFHIVKYLIRK